MGLREGLNSKQVTVKIATGEILAGTCHETDDAGVWLQVAGNSRTISGVPTATPGQHLILFVPFSQINWLAVSMNHSDLGTELAPSL
jgi:hypothetical protein